MLNHLLFSDIYRNVFLMPAFTNTLVLFLCLASLADTSNFVLSLPNLGLLFSLSYWGYSFLNDKNGTVPPSKPALVSFVLYSLQRKPWLVMTQLWPKPIADPGEVPGFPQDQGSRRVSHSHLKLQEMMGKFRVEWADKSKRGGQSCSYN